MRRRKPAIHMLNELLITRQANGWELTLPLLYPQRRHVLDREIDEGITSLMDHPVIRGGVELAKRKLDGEQIVGDDLERLLGRLPERSDEENDLEVPIVVAPAANPNVYVFDTLGKLCTFLCTWMEEQDSGLSDLPKEYL